MSDYKTFAIWGAGTLGGRIAARLLDRKATVIILSRPSSVNNDKNRDLESKGAEVRSYDVTSADASFALKDVDVLISTAGFEAIGLQSLIVKAAASVGVKLFVPSEFGDTTDNRPESLMTLKVKIREEAMYLGLPTVAFFSGLWPEGLPWLGFDIKNGKIEIKGQGDAEISMTSVEDVARFVAYVLIELPRDQLRHAKFTLQGDKMTLNTLAAKLEKLSDNKLDISHIPRSVLEENVLKNPRDAFASLFLGWDLGKGSHPNPLSNGMYPDWNPKTAVEVLQPYLQ